MRRPREIDGLPVAEFAFPGALRDRLVAAILRGEKTATASLRAEYRPEGAACGADIQDGEGAACGADPQEAWALPTLPSARPTGSADEIAKRVSLPARPSATTGRAERRLQTHGHMGEDELPEVGQCCVVVDSHHRPVGVIETTEVRVLPVREVDDEFARDEGEGFESSADWRIAHERFWGTTPEREAAGEPSWTIDDETLVVCERFRLVRRLDSGRAGSARSSVRNDRSSGRP